MIVRREIPSFLRERLDEITAGSTVSGLAWAVEGRDGTGPKTEIPWTRVYDRELSPSATIGWYVVYLFSALGDRVYLSLGHGSTQWTGVDFKPRPEDELRSMAAWARHAVSGVLPAEFRSEITLDARRSNLGAAYEAGTVLAKPYETHQIPPDETLERDLSVLVSGLSVLYRHELVDPLMPGVDPPEVRELAEDIASAAGKSRGRRSSAQGKGQGFGLSKKQKHAVERCSMDQAMEYYRSRGWTVRDVGATRSYDIHATREHEELFIEVKGTTSAGQSVVLTANEVDLHRSKFPQTALFVVSEIALGGSSDAPVASGGNAREIQPWMPGQDDLFPMAYRYVLPDSSQAQD